MTEKRTFSIAVVPGDGIGTEVVPEGVRVLDALAAAPEAPFAFAYDTFPWGCRYYLDHGVMLPPDGLDTLQGYDAIYFGAVGWPGVPDHISLWGLRLAICQGFDQYANIRPVRLLAGVQSPLRHATRENMDWVVVRENTEGEYAGVGGRNFIGRGVGKEIAMQAGLFTAEGCERIIRYAFDLARTRARRKVTSVTKSNAQQYGMTLWDETFARVAARLPRCRDRAMAGRCDGGTLRAAPGNACCGRGEQPVRRHPVRPRQRPCGEPRHRGEREPQPRTPLPQHVRAGTWLCARHCRAGHRQSDRRNLELPR